MPRDAVVPNERPLVCVLGLRGIPGVMGGVESHCEELLPRLALSALHLRFVAIGRKPYLGRTRKTFQGVTVIPLPAPRRQSVETLVSSFLGVLYARWIGARAVHIHAVASGLVAPLARLMRMKVVLTVHGADYQRAKWGVVARTVLRLGERLGIRNAHAVICVSPSLTRQLQERYPRQAHTITFIPNGAPPLKAAGEEDAVLRRFGVERSSFLLAVGRVEQGKGFELLIDAFQRSGRKGKLIIVGGAHHDSRYESRLMKLAGERVIFSGVLPRDQLVHLYRTAELFVLPSLHEGLSICALEAGLAGCPMLLSDIPGNRDLGLPEIHYFTSGDVKGLSLALQSPAETYAVSRDMFSGFDWEQISAKTLTIYNSLIGPNLLRGA
jgi:glycosyltransferase involved in cell wall biosynthesis